MITIVKWFVRILISVVFVDWFIMRYKGRKEVKPAGMVMIDVETHTVSRVAFGCSAENLHEGDIVPMEIRLVDKQE